MQLNQCSFCGASLYFVDDCAYGLVTMEMPDNQEILFYLCLCDSQGHHLDSGKRVIQATASLMKFMYWLSRGKQRLAELGKLAFPFARNGVSCLPKMKGNIRLLLEISMQAAHGNNVFSHWEVKPVLSSCYRNVTSAHSFLHFWYLK